MVSDRVGLETETTVSQIQRPLQMSVGRRVALVDQVRQELAVESGVLKDKRLKIATIKAVLVAPQVPVVSRTPPTRQRPRQLTVSVEHRAAGVCPHVCCAVRTGDPLDCLSIEMRTMRHHRNRSKGKACETLRHRSAGRIRTVIRIIPRRPRRGRPVIMEEGEAVVVI